MFGALTSFRSTQLIAHDWWVICALCLVSIFVFDLTYARKRPPTRTHPANCIRCIGVHRLHAVHRLRHVKATNSFILTRLETQHAVHRYSSRTQTQQKRRSNFTDKKTTTHKCRPEDEVSRAAIRRRRRRKTSCNSIDPCYEYDHTPGGRTK